MGGEGQKAVGGGCKVGYAEHVGLKDTRHTGHKSKHRGRGRDRGCGKEREGGEREREEKEKEGAYCL